MKNMTGKQERKAGPRINLEKEGKKRASAETESVWSITMPRLARITPGAVPTCGFRKSTGKSHLRSFRTSAEVYSGDVSPAASQRLEQMRLAMLQAAGEVEEERALRWGEEGDGMVFSSFF